MSSVTTRSDEWAIEGNTLSEAEERRVLFAALDSFK
jgi:hypothetical protein